MQILLWQVTDAVRSASIDLTHVNVASIAVQSLGQCSPVEDNSCFPRPALQENYLCNEEGRVSQTCRNGSLSSAITPPLEYAFSSPSTNKRCSAPEAVGTSIASNLNRYRPCIASAGLTAPFVSLMLSQSQVMLDHEPCDQSK